MQSTRLLQLIAIVAVAGLIVFVYLNGKSDSSPAGHSSALSGSRSGDSKAGMPVSSFDFLSLESDVKSRLPGKVAAEINSAEKNEGAAKVADGSLIYIAHIFDSLNQPALAGYYYKKLTESNPDNEKYWALAGTRFYEAVDGNEDEAAKADFVDLSIHSLEKAVILNPRDLDCKGRLGVDYIDEGNVTKEPKYVMQGVGLLREIIQTDSNNIFAIYNLGIQSIRSTQFDKAVKRFKRLIELQPGEAINYRLLGNSYQGLGDKEKALEAYQRYQRLAPNDQMKADADDLIGKLK